jgi:hypothetical protein
LHVLGHLDTRVGARFESLERRMALLLHRVFTRTTFSVRMTAAESAELEQHALTAGTGPVYGSMRHRRIFVGVRRHAAKGTGSARRDRRWPQPGRHVPTLEALPRTLPPDSQSVAG